MLNDPKYAIVDNQLVNRATGKPIPADMPVMIFVAKDALAARKAILPYVDACLAAGLGTHADSATERLNAFLAFESAHPELMKKPDTSAPAEGEVLFGIRMIPCTSSNIKAHGYDAERKVLALQFTRSNYVYHYANVPQAVYDELQAAESIGSFAAQRITGTFEGARQS